MRGRRARGALLALLAGGALTGCSAIRGEEQVDVGTMDRGPIQTGEAEIRWEIPAGTRFEAELQQSLSTDGNSAGDEWSAIVTHAVTDGGHVLIPRGTIVEGTVTRAGPVDIEGETRQLLAIDPTRLEAGGDSYRIEADVVEAKGTSERDLVTGENAAILGGGALAGTLLGEILLDEPALGAALGAAGGTAIAVARSDRRVELERGAVIVLELEDPVEPTVLGRN